MPRRNEAKNSQPPRSLLEKSEFRVEKKIHKIEKKQEFGGSVGDVVGFLEDLMMEESPLLLLFQTSTSFRCFHLSFKDSCSSANVSQKKGHSYFAV